MFFLKRIIIALLLLSKVFAAEIYIGKSSVDITPQGPVALMGQFGLRVSEKAETPLTAHVVALESREGGLLKETAIFVSCDLLYIPNSLKNRVRAEVQRYAVGIDTDKIILNATHTHTGPVLEDVAEDYSFSYPVPKTGVIQVGDYVSYLSGRLSEGIVKAWKSREQGSIAWGMDRAAIGYNRRAVYDDETTVMYGNTAVSNFKSIEGYEDHDINTLFFWNKKGELLAMCIELACPAQEVEHRTTINADYWHPTREKLYKIFGKDVAVVSMLGASGDLSPRPIYRKEAVERMNKLRNTTRMEDIARRIVHAVRETYDVVKNDKQSDIPLIHRTERLVLPMRAISEQEYKSALEVYKTGVDEMSKNPSSSAEIMARTTWNKGVIDRYARLKANPNLKFETDIHVLRLGDVALCTNQFELYTDYGIQIQSRSKALQTFVVQLAGAGSYLPTDQAIKGGGYSAVIQSDVVGAYGGKELVESTLRLINSMWP